MKYGQYDVEQKPNTIYLLHNLL